MHTPTVCVYKYTHKQTHMYCTYIHTKAMDPIH